MKDFPPDPGKTDKPSRQICSRNAEVVTSRFSIFGIWRSGVQDGSQRAHLFDVCTWYLLFLRLRQFYYSGVQAFTLRPGKIGRSKRHLSARGRRVFVMTFAIAGILLP